MIISMSIRIPLILTLKLIPVIGNKQNIKNNIWNENCSWNKKLEQKFHPDPDPGQPGWLVGSPSFVDSFQGDVWCSQVFFEALGVLL